MHHFLFYCRSSTHDTGEEGEENRVSFMFLFPSCLAHGLYCCFLRVRGVLLNHAPEQIIWLEFSQHISNDVLATGVNNSKIETLGLTVSVDSQWTFFEKKCLGTVVNR